MMTMTKNVSTDPTTQLAQLRSQRLELLAQRRATERAPVAPDESRARLSAWFDEVGGRWPADAATLVAPFTSPGGVAAPEPGFGWRPFPLPPPLAEPGPFAAFMVHVLREPLESVLQVQ
jgi:hypothetical protein